MTTTTAKTLRSLYYEGRTAIVNGHEWSIGLSPDGKRAHLRRDVIVKAHWHGMDYQASGSRCIRIVRDANTMVECD